MIIALATVNCDETGSVMDNRTVEKVSWKSF